MLPDPYGLYPQPEGGSVETVDFLFSGGGELDQSDDEDQKPRHREQSLQHDEKHFDEDEQNASFDRIALQPFLYNARIFLVSIPGLIISFSLGGDL